MEKLIYEIWEPILVSLGFIWEGRKINITPELLFIEIDWKNLLLFLPDFRT